MPAILGGGVQFIGLQVVWLLVTGFSCSSKRSMNVAEQSSVLWADSGMDCSRATGYKD
jgi:hypothetical protein